MKPTAALKALSRALALDAVIFTAHALEMMTFAGLDLAFVQAELSFAVDRGAVVANRSTSGRFTGHGRATIFSFEVVSPTVVVVTIMLQE